MVVRPLTRVVHVARVPTCLALSSSHRHPASTNPPKERGNGDVSCLLLLGSPSIRCRHGLLLLTRPKTKIWQHQGEPRFDQML